MRKVKYLSPSGIDCFYSDRDEYYIRYLSEFKPPRPPQTQPMSIGSAFDAFVKSNLHQTLFGKTPEFEVETLLETQVEPHNREWAKVNGMLAFRRYKECGALADLLLDLEQAQTEPKFEDTLKGSVGFNGITIDFLGKPDLFYINKAGTPVVLDWKVNGWCSKYKTSPMKGYLKIRGHNPKGAHKDTKVIHHLGMRINTAHNLEDVNDKWARQLAIYAWLMGCEIGGDFIVCIDQLCGNPAELRIAEHRTKISPNFQQHVFSEAATLRAAIDSRHIFVDLSLEESMLRCRTLDQRAKVFMEEDPMFLEMTR